LLLQELPLKSEPLDLAGLDAFFHALAADTPFARLDRIARRLATLHPAEGETLLRLLGGDLGLGLSADLFP
jgi:hypothetical protein